MNIELLQRVINDQNTNFLRKDCGITRILQANSQKTLNQILVITGIRRCGKSTYLRQMAEEYKSFYYINFDDERLINFSVEDFDNLMILWKKNSDSKIILIDEIQNIPKWERFVRRIFDEGYKIIITGSNAKLLSSELSTHLTGRHKRIELFPFSFSEYLTFHKFNFKLPVTTEQISSLMDFSEKYIETGGFPEFLIFQDVEYLKRIFEDILYKDVIVRFNIRELKSFKELASYLITNFCSEISYNSLQKALGIKSPNSVKDYIEYLSESYLVFELFKYDYSLKKRAIYNKKIYTIDNGLRNQIAFRFSEDSGRLLENTVFLHLKRKGKEIYFHQNKRECDFLIKEKNQITTAIQVTENISTRNLNREIEGLIEAKNEYNPTEYFIISRNQKEIIEYGGDKINIIPIYEWLLKDEIN